MTVKKGSEPTAQSADSASPSRSSRQSASSSTETALQPAKPAPSDAEAAQVSGPGKSRTSGSKSRSAGKAGATQQENSNAAAPAGAAGKTAAKKPAVSRTRATRQQDSAPASEEAAASAASAVPGAPAPQAAPERRKTSSRQTASSSASANKRPSRSAKKTPDSPGESAPEALSPSSADSPETADTDSLSSAVKGRSRSSRSKPALPEQAQAALSGPSVPVTDASAADTSAASPATGKTGVAEADAENAAAGKPSAAGAAQASSRPATAQRSQAKSGSGRSRKSVTPLPASAEAAETARPAAEPAAASAESSRRTDGAESAGETTGNRTADAPALPAAGHRVTGEAVLGNPDPAHRLLQDNVFDAADKTSETGPSDASAAPGRGGSARGKARKSGPRATRKAGDAGAGASEAAAGTAEERAGGPGRTAGPVAAQQNRHVDGSERAALQEEYGNGSAADAQARPGATPFPEAGEVFGFTDASSGFIPPAFAGPTGQEPVAGEEQATASLPGSEAVGTPAPEEGGEKKRRSRSRRGGRGRKKSAQAQVSQETSAAEGLEQAALEQTDADTGAERDRRPQQPIPDRDEDVLATGEDDLIDEDESPIKARRKMFVSVLPEEQVEVVITEEGQVQEYYVEMLHQAKTKGNIYKGIIHNVDPNLQAAFVSYGGVKNGFLQIDEVHPEYYVIPHEAGKGRKYPPIQKVLKAGQEVLVQVVKEPAGTKGAFLTTYLSMPGRFLVLTPGREQIGVSRKVENEGERARLRELLEGLNPGPGLGVIVRTVSMGASKTNLQRDLQYLKRTWKEVRARGTTEKAPCLVYQEMDLTSRAVRDYLTEAVGEIWIDDEFTANAVNEVAQALFPRKQNLVRVHKDTGSTLFERFNLQRQLDQIYSREVALPSGGRLVIDPTEALTAIDINSGRSGGKSNFEDMAYRTNMEAAKMIPLQLRLRDIGGQVVADFIEMRDKNHWREVEKTLRNGMKVDRARYDVGRIGPFGMLEIVRQRLGSSAISISTEPCPICKGTGIRRNMEWQSQHALREIQRLLRQAQAQQEESICFQADPTLALHLLNQKRQRLMEMEQHFGVRLDIQIKLPDHS